MIEDPIFLSLNHVLRLHDQQIKAYGGTGEIRDVALIESAAMQPRQSFGGRYLHHSLAEMAAAYLFHIAQNHGFVDGNKRTAAAAALMFLELNDIDVDEFDLNDMEAITLGVADGTVDKNTATDFFRVRVKSDE